jgi:septum formation protein
MLILASNSPRRKQILEMVGLKFKVVPSHFDETSLTLKNIYKLPYYLAKNKALTVAKEYPNDIILAADTDVFVDGKMLGKPNGPSGVKKILKHLSNKTHEVITGVTIVYKNKRISFESKTKVTFYKISDQEIKDYVKTKEPFDKSGAYAIQGYGARFIKKIDGDYYTIMGLPIARVIKELRSLKKDR